MMKQPGRAPARGRTTLILLLLGGLLIAAALCRLLTGESFGWPDGDVLTLRVDRLLIGLAVGAGLAVSGAVLQALLRNPLASPFIIGVSSGAALGANVGQWLLGAGLISVGVAASIGGTHAFALGGAAATLVVVYALSQRGGRVDPLGLLLVGVIVNAINGAALMCLTYVISPADKARMAVWMLGYFNDNASRHAIVAVLAIVVAGTVAATAYARSLDLSTFSDAEAEAMGVNLPRLRFVLFVVVALATSATVVVAGPIGFVGLIAPHAVRLAIGPAHRPLIVGSALAGATLVVGADTLIKAVDFGQGLLPLGALTAVIGGPVFLVLLRGQLGRVQG